MSESRVLERGAGSIEWLARRVQIERIRGLLGEDAAFLRRLDARLRDGEERPRATAVPTPGGRQGSARRLALLAVGSAFLAGIALAKLVEWKALTEPRVR